MGFVSYQEDNQDAAGEPVKEKKQNAFLFSHIPDSPLAEMLGMDNPEGGGETAVWNGRERLRREKHWKEKIIRNVIYYKTIDSVFVWCVSTIRGMLRGCSPETGAVGNYRERHIRT